MSWLSFTARRWFSAAPTIARRRDGRAWNVSHTKFLSPISTLQPKPNPASCHFSCVGVQVTVTTSLRLTVNFTTLPAPRSPVPAVIPGARRHHRRHGPDGGVHLQAGLRQAIQQQVGGIPPLSCTV